MALTPRTYQALAVASALRTYAKTGIKVNTAYTPKNMLATATAITGNKYKRTELLKAADDLKAWAETQ